MRSDSLRARFSAGRARVRWTPAWVVRGLPYDTLVMGHGTVTTNVLRLWYAVAAEEFDPDAFQVGEENFLLFGLTAPEEEDQFRRGSRTDGCCGN